MDKIKKFFLNMKTHFRRNNPQQEAIESQETEDAVFAKDEDPSKQTMNSGGFSSLRAPLRLPVLM